MAHVVQIDCQACRDSQDGYCQDHYVVSVGDRKQAERRLLDDELTAGLNQAHAQGYFDTEED